MANSTEKERKKLFSTIIQSLQEYSEEQINDPEEIKSEIVDLLKTHRPVKLADYEYGLSRNLKKDQQLIVKEKDDETKVLVYAKKGLHWYCSNRRTILNCRSSSLKIRYGIAFAPIVHGGACNAKDYSSVMEIQELLKQGKTKEANRLMHKNSSSKNDSSISLSTSMLNESTSDIENESILEQSIAENTSTSIDSNSTPLSQQQSSVPALEEIEIQSASRSTIKRELDDAEDCMILDEPAAKKTKTEATKNVEAFAFEHPSTTTIKQICEKLKIEYSLEAYKFWANISFEKVPVSSNRIETHEFKSSNIFACLSLFFTGKNDYCCLIQHMFNSAFRAASDTMSRAQIDMILFNPTVTNELIEFIASFLACRVGIYKNGKLKKFGNWKDENIALTLVLSLIDGKFAVVLDL
uniref:Uncharacterized protein n=1 Tax=Panagrolaimus sp. ES5 TaxID=591445 RepID=A0AC34FEC4_9BILA